MAKGRKPTAAAPTDHILTAGELVEAHKPAASAVATIDLLRQDVSDDRNLANQMVGEVSVANMFQKFATVVSLSKLAKVKNSKSYQALKGQRYVNSQGQNCEHVGTWADFCESINLSPSKVDEDLRNLEMFGEEALQALQDCGAGYRDIRRLRKLPEEARTLIAGQVVDITNKDELLALIDDIEVKRNTAEAETSSLKAEATSREEYITNQADKLRKAERAAKKLEKAEGLPLWGHYKRASVMAAGGALIDWTLKLRQIIEEVLTDELPEGVQIEDVMPAVARYVYATIWDVQIEWDKLLRHADQTLAGYLADDRYKNLPLGIPDDLEPTIRAIAQKLAQVTEEALGKGAIAQRRNELGGVEQGNQ